MNDYNKNTFWRCKNEETGEVKYYMRINNLYVEVQKEVYQVCFNSYRKALRESAKLVDYPVISLDQENDQGNTLLDYIRSDDDVENTVFKNDILESIETALQMLDSEDRKIVEWFLFYEKTEQEVADLLGVKKYIVNYRKRKIFEKIKNLLENFRQD